MKLVLANNQSQKFLEFYGDLEGRSKIPFEYASYKSFLFWFDSTSDQRIEAFNTKSGRLLSDYDGVYINSHFFYELAAATAIACDYLRIHFIDQELHDPPSLSKLTMHAKLAAAGVLSPKSFGGSKQAIIAGKEIIEQKLTFPMILKRADADRGIDNFKISDWAELVNLLEPHSINSIWILQEFLPNKGFYLVTFYDQKPAFSIFRTLLERPDGDSKRAHFYKPSGGANAELVEITKLPVAVLKACQAGLDALNRQVAGVDCIYDASANLAYVLEVNHNPQLVTIETFKAIRQQAFLDNLSSI